MSTLVRDGNAQKHEECSENETEPSDTLTSSTADVQYAGDTVKKGKPSVSFQLTDDEQLLERLSTVDLTEDDTESMLEEAYKINKQLKAHLKQQENADKLATAISRDTKRGGSKVLPPIHGGPRGVHATHSVYSPLRQAAASHPKSQTGNRDVTKSEPRRPKSLSNPSRMSPGSPAPASSHIRGKTFHGTTQPQWDDRFSFR